MGTPFSHENFPPHTDPASQDSGMAELYPANLQDEVNESYTHDKVLPRQEGTDYVKTKEEYSEDASGTQEQGS